MWYVSSHFFFYISVILFFFMILDKVFQLVLSKNKSYFHWHFELSFLFKFHLKIIFFLLIILGFILLSQTWKFIYLKFFCFSDLTLCFCEIFLGILFAVHHNYNSGFISSGVHCYLHLGFVLQFSIWFPHWLNSYT